MIFEKTYGTSDKEEIEEQTDCKTILEPNTFSEF